MSKLTKKSVDDANALPKLDLIWDGELRGFRFPVQPGGVKNVSVRSHFQLPQVWHPPKPPLREES